MADHDEVVRFVERILIAARSPLAVAGQEVSATVSIGVTFYRPGISGDQLLRNADRAMYAAGAGQKSIYRVRGNELPGCGRDLTSDAKFLWAAARYGRPTSADISRWLVDSPVKAIVNLTFALSY
jgi:hypothetical protein